MTTPERKRQLRVIAKHKKIEQSVNAGILNWEMEYPTKDYKLNGLQEGDILSTAERKDLVHKIVIALRGANL